MWILSFLQFLNKGKDFKKNTGLIGLITGIIRFILIFIYFVYIAYIFTNDVYKTVEKLYPNGAKFKKINNVDIIIGPPIIWWTSVECFRSCGINSTNPTTFSRG